MMSPMMPNRKRGVAILGATGSVGTSTLDVLARHPDRFEVIALTAHVRSERLYEQCVRFRPRLAVLDREEDAHALAMRLRAAGIATHVRHGVDGLNEAATHADAPIVMSAIVGAAGLLPLLAAVRAGRQVLIANKEPLVMCGHLLLQAAAHSGATLLPIDSEHNAIFQCLPPGGGAGVAPAGVRRILLTCSGGPLLRAPRAQLAGVTPDQACAHPRWAMGRKISVDSATLMNKGLEVIEACCLFGLSPDQIEVVIHPQSTVHSLVEYADGSMLAQLAAPDMRVPIAHALAFPERMASGAPALDLLAIGRLDFEAPDLDRFPCLRLAFRAARAGATVPTILNAANEVAVASFLHHDLPFEGIPAVIEATLDALSGSAGEGAVQTHEATLEQILAEDHRARAFAIETIRHRMHGRTSTHAHPETGPKVIHCAPKRPVTGAS